jgi:hypothetical protein
MSPIRSSVGSLDPACVWARLGAEPARSAVPAPSGANAEQMMTDEAGTAGPLGLETAGRLLVN